MRCSICGGHLTNQRCDDCGMIFPPEDRYTLHHTEAVSYTHLDVYKRQGHSPRG